MRVVFEEFIRFEDSVVHSVIA